MDSLVASSVNLSILIGFLFYKLRQPIREFVSERHHSIASQVKTARDQLREAQRQYDEFSGKLKAIDAEITALRENMRQESSAAKQRIISEARTMAATLSADAKTAADGLFAELKGQLYSELSVRVLDRAEFLLKDRLTGDDRARIRQEFSKQVENIQ